MTGSVSIKRWVLLGLLLVLMSCSGGTGGSGSPVVAVGTVTEIGSVVVNGIKFDTAGASIILNGQQGSEADLQVGQVVTVRGRLAPSGVTGIAETVIFENNAKGPIDSIDLATARLVVLGQTVLVDEATQFGDTPLSELGVGDVVELSGFTDAEGALRATRVENTPDTLEIETSGTISALNEVNQIFILHELLVVDFSMAALINVPGNQLRNGQFVEVKSSQNVMDGVLIADRVEVKEVVVRGNPGELVEIQGIVTRGLAADNTFNVNGQTVRLTSDTVFEAGKPDNIAVDVRIEVEGVFDAAGIIIAEAVELGTGVEINGTVTRGLATDNTFEVDDQPVRLTPDTVFVGGTASDITVGVPIEVEGAFDNTGVFVAAVVDFFDDLEGTITQGLTGDTFAVDDQPVRLTPDTVFVGGTASDIAIGVPVEVEGFLDEEGVLVATEVEFIP
jgi:type IV secretory pathway VirB3-like protein